MTVLQKKKKKIITRNYTQYMAPFIIYISVFFLKVSSFSTSHSSVSVRSIPLGDAHLFTFIHAYIFSVVAPSHDDVHRLPAKLNHHALCRLRQLLLYPGRLTMRIAPRAVTQPIAGTMVWRNYTPSSSLSYAAIYRATRFRCKCHASGATF